MKKVFVGNRIIGEINLAQNAFVTHRNEQHYFRLFDGFGLNKRVLENLKQQGILEVWVFFEKEDEIALWKSKIEDWLLHGEPWDWQGNSGRHLDPRVLKEEQLVLNKRFFEVV